MSSKENNWSVVHNHRFGITVYLVISDTPPSEKEVIQALDIDFEAGRGESIDITQHHMGPFDMDAWRENKKNPTELNELLEGAEVGYEPKGGRLGKLKPTEPYAPAEIDGPNMKDLIAYLETRVVGSEESLINPLSLEEMQVLLRIFNTTQSRVEDLEKEIEQLNKENNEQ